ncbi:MAG: TRAP transporter substrate-binding protein [Rhodospirillales bacterium]|nr:TRAP transporter substrate-binding protein [Rhodospirillales bacterium]
MRNLVIGAIFGIVTGAVVGATLIGPQLVEKIPGFTGKPNSGEVIPEPETAANKAQSENPKITLKTPPVSPSQPGLRWRMASAFSSTFANLGDLAKRLERQIGRVSDGRLRIQLHEPGTLVASDQMFDAVRSGTIEAAFGTTSFWAAKIPALRLFESTPFGPPAQEFLSWFYFSGGQKIYQDIYHKQGIHGLICGVAAAEASGWFKKKIESVDDLKGLRMRISGLGAQVMSKLGVETQSMSDGDVFVAFESGMLDAAEFSQPSVDLKLGLYRMADHYYFPGWHQPVTLVELIINLDTWDALRTTQQTQIATVCGDNVRYSLAQSEAAQFIALKELVRLGVNLESWPTEVLDKLNEAWVEVVSEEAQQDKDFQRVWRSMQRFREEFGIWRELSRP